MDVEATGHVYVMKVQTRSTWGWSLSQAVVALSLLAGCSRAPVSELSEIVFALDAPELLDLGTFASDEPFEARFDVQNVGDQPLRFLGVVPTDPPSPAGIQLTATIDPAELAPGDVAEVRVTALAAAAPSDDYLGTLRFDVDGFSPGDPRLPVVEVVGQVSLTGLVVEPNPLTIGPVTFSETGSGIVTIRNLRRLQPTPIVVFAARVAGGRAQYDEAVSRGNFGPLPRVGRDGELTTLGPGESFDIEIFYTAPSDPGEAKEQAVWRVTTCPLEPDACAVPIVVQGIPDVEAPRIQASPAVVSFGSTPVGERVERPLVVANFGPRPLELTGVELIGSSNFSTGLEPIVFPPLQQLTTTITYLPSELGSDTAQLILRSNDPLNPELVVQITGSGVVLPPCQFSATPTSINFGEDPVERRSVTIRNTGTDTCVMFDPRIDLDEGTEPGTFAFAEEPAPSVRLGPGESVQLFVRFDPPVPGPKSGVLSVRTSNDQSIEVPLRGGNEEGVSLVCTSAQTTAPDGPVNLTAAVVGNGTPVTYSWQVVRSPGSGTFTLDPPSAQAAAEFTPRSVGEYEIQVDVELTEGDDLTCTMLVIAQSTGMKAILTWDGDGDLDLHLRRFSQRPWFSQDDCYFDNMMPQWVAGEAPGTGPNPRLDRDDTSGEGPENIDMFVPELGIPYFLGVSHFERAAGRTATVELFCGRAASVLTLTSRPFRGRSTGNCSSNDFWRVARVTFTAVDQCQVDIIDTYTTTRRACRGP